MSDYKDYVSIREWCDQQGASISKMIRLLKKNDFRTFRTPTELRAKVTDLEACFSKDIFEQQNKAVKRTEKSKIRARQENLGKQIFKILFPDFDRKALDPPDVLTAYEKHLETIETELRTLSYKKLVTPL